MRKRLLAVLAYVLAAFEAPHRVVLRRVRAPAGVRAFGTRHNYRCNEAFVGRVLNRSRYGASGTPSLTFRKP